MLIIDFFFFKREIPGEVEKGRNQMLQGLRAHEGPCIGMDTPEQTQGRSCVLEER